MWEWKKSWPRGAFSERFRTDRPALVGGWMCAHGGGRVRGLLKVGRTGAPNGRVGGPRTGLGCRDSAEVFFLLLTANCLFI